MSISQKNTEFLSNRRSLKVEAHFSKSFEDRSRHQLFTSPTNLPLSKINENAPISKNYIKIENTCQIKFKPKSSIF